MPDEVAEALEVAERLEPVEPVLAAAALCVLVGIAEANFLC